MERERERGGTLKKKARIKMKRKKSPTYQQKQPERKRGSKYA